MGKVVDKHVYAEEPASMRSIVNPIKRSSNLTIYNEDTIAKCIANLVRIALMIKGVTYKEEAVIEKYTKRFEMRARLEPLRLCGNDEYLHPTDIVELLGIAALCEAMGAVLKEGYNEEHTVVLRQKLDDISRMLTNVVFNYIPYREIETVHVVHGRLLESLSDCATL